MWLDLISGRGSLVPISSSLLDGGQLLIGLLDFHKPENKIVGNNITREL